jgi:hypothetical protein
MDDTFDPFDLPSSFDPLGEEGRPPHKRRAFRSKGLPSTFDYGSRQAVP